MDGPARSRPPSAGPPDHKRHSASAPPQPPTNPSFTSAKSSVPSNHFYTLPTQATSGAFNDPTFTQDFSQQAHYSLDPTYTDFQGQEQQQQSYPQPPVLSSQDIDLTNHFFLQATHGYGVGAQGSNHVLPDTPSQNTSSVATTADSSAFPPFDFNQTSFEQDTALDPSVLLDNPLDLSSNPQNASADYGGTLDPMATTMQSHAPTPPHLLPEMARRHSNSPSPHTSPNFQQGSFQTFTRPRNVSDTLDPSSAMFPVGTNEWSAMGAYRGHRRTPSDNYSDISSHSNHASPYLGHLDSYDTNSHSSPLLNPAQDPSFNGDLGLQDFSLSENQVPQQHSFHSPGHSPQVSPRLVPQQALPPFTAADHYGLHTASNGQYMQHQNGLELFPGVAQEPFPALNYASPGNDLGAADQMSPPEINIQYAPPSRNPMENVKLSNGDDTLSPPLRSRLPRNPDMPHHADSSAAQSRTRHRAKSDSYAGSRPTSPAYSGRGRSPSLQPQSNDMLTPHDNGPTSRSPSPARGRNGSLGARARSSSNASEQREYILDLANPERTPSSGGDSKRVQKHPATFQCHLCPKRFTRAYNLRSHLRTHTDERPFVCTVCGKAFARQHDRKRHEGLHSGEKKFVCKGNLQSGTHWGCGRRFARADALGRHFRSEAGRVCIKPLLEEEAADRQRAWMEEQQQAQVPAGLVAPQPMLAQPQIDLMGSFLPAALLQQYPALAGIDWNAIPQGAPPEEEYAGRGSFDASSGGEYYDDMSGDEVGQYPADPSLGAGDMNLNQQPLGMAQAHAGAQGFGGGGGGVYGNAAGDYLSDFEGR